MDPTCNVPTRTWGDTEWDMVAGTGEPVSDTYCSVWTWCPCWVDNSVSYCDRESSSCPEYDVCDECDPEMLNGEWIFVCGDCTIGPPCYDGSFVGEAAFVCRCPTLGSASVSFSDIWHSSSSSLCPDMPPTPFPFDIPQGEFRETEFVPQILFPPEWLDPGAKGAWTWCPCDYTTSTDFYPHPNKVWITCSTSSPPCVGEYSLTGQYHKRPYYSNGTYYLWFEQDESNYGKPTWHISTALGNSTTCWTFADACMLGDYEPDGVAYDAVKVEDHCPWPGTCAGATGTGEWIFRGGCEDLGPPPVVGRYYGETIFVGYCCEESSSFSSSSYDISLSYKSGSCSDMPEFPLYWWDVDMPLGKIGHIQLEDMYRRMYDPENDGVCGVRSLCTGWIWCECGWRHRDCEHIYEQITDCPWTPSEPPQPEQGQWIFYEGTGEHGPPCTVGRFFGEIVYFCECPTSSSAGCACEKGGLEATGATTPLVADYYNPEGYYNNRIYYKSCEQHDDGCTGTSYWYIWWDNVAFDWILSRALGDTACKYFLFNGAFDSDPDDTYTAQNGASGSVVVDVCFPCETSSCASSMNVAIAGLTGTCADANGNYSLTKISTILYEDTNTAVGDGCAANYISLVCYSGAWTAYLQIDTCGAGFNEFGAWSSDPRPEDVDGCPPEGAYSMNELYNDCTGGGTPTFTVSHP